jgi:glycosyltransferase involved in cell wall biosynthesis
LNQQRGAPRNDAAGCIFGDGWTPLRMLSVIIATQDSERALVPTLAALVSGAISGLVSEVVVADGGSRDDTEVVAEHAGCNFMVVEGALARRLNAGAAVARARWLLFLRPGTVLEATWIGDARRFVERPSNTGSAAVFRRGASARAGLRDALSLLAAALGKRPSPEQGLLIAKPLYTTLNGHSETAADPEADLIRRIGRRHRVMLPSVAYSAGILD